MTTAATPLSERSAWKALARLHHPDLHKGGDARMKRINAAYEVVGDPVKRKEYDRSLS